MERLGDYLADRVDVVCARDDHTKLSGIWAGAPAHCTLRRRADHDGIPVAPARQAANAQQITGQGAPGPTSPGCLLITGGQLAGDSMRAEFEDQAPAQADDGDR